MSKFIKLIKRYSFFLITLCLLIIIYFFNSSIALNTLKSAKSNLIQMLSVVPPVMLLLGLVDAWIPRETLMKYMGNNAGILGPIIALLIGSVAAGPSYAAFPFAAVMLKKGVRFSNIIIFLNAWCVTKISTLLFEISSLGYKFTFVRLLIDIPGVIIMGYLVESFMSKDDLNKLYYIKDSYVSCDTTK